MKPGQITTEQDRRDYFIAQGMMALIQRGYQTQDVALAAIRLADEVLALTAKAEASAPVSAPAAAKQVKK